jgi:isoleucyl-tRNA synthetase
MYNGSANFFREWLESRYFRLRRPRVYGKNKDIQDQKPGSAQNVMTS